MSKVVEIGGRLVSKETGGVVTGANAILDDTKGKKQNVINGEVDAELERLDSAKQNVLSFDNAPTEGSNNPVKSGGVFAADKALSDAIEAILILIPSAASELNKLADMAFVNSTVSTNTATFRGTYNSVSGLSLPIDATHEQIATALGSVIATADNNDYAFVQVPTNASTPTEIAKTERYKFNGTNWAYEYDLNTSGFTAAQWAAINSSITAGLVAKLSALPTNQELTQALAGKQDNLTFDQSPTEDSTNPVTSGGVYAALAAIMLLVPSEATSSNKLADKAFVVTSILNAIPAFRGTFTTAAELDEVTGMKDGDIALLLSYDSDGETIYTIKQYISDEWITFFALTHRLLNKPATTGTTGDYPYNGMGRVVLPKNIVNIGTDEEPNNVNQLMQSLFVGANTIYYVRYDYVIGENITIPNNSVIVMDGGSIVGTYTLTGSATKIIDNAGSIGCPTAGTWIESTDEKLSDLRDEIEQRVMPAATSPYDSGYAAQEILDVLKLMTNDASVLSQFVSHEKVHDIKNTLSALFIPTTLCIKGSGQATDLKICDVVSATASAVTLSAADAAIFPEYGIPVACKFSNGTYKVFNLKKSGNTLIAGSDADVNLTNCIKVQTAWHDSQHLTPYGYRALAQFIVDKTITRDVQMDNTYVGGADYSYDGAAPSVTLSTSPEFFTDRFGLNIAGNVGSISNFATWSNRGLSTRAMASYSCNRKYNQAGATSVVAGQYFEVSYNLPAQYPGTLIIEGGSPKGNWITHPYGVGAVDYTGRVQMDVYVNDTVVYTKVLPGWNDKYVIPNMNCSAFKVRFTYLDSAPTAVIIYSILYYRAFSEVALASAFTDKKVAMLGDSWGQYTDAITGSTLPDDDPDKGDIALLPAEIARYGNCEVDDWSKGGMTSANWGLVKIDELLASKKYDYVVIEFWINDINSGMSATQWLTNLKTIADKCKAAGARPIIVRPCGSMGQSYSWSGAQVAISKGFLWNS